MDRPEWATRAEDELVDVAARIVGIENVLFSVNHVADAGTQKLGRVEITLSLRSPANKAE